MDPFTSDTIPRAVGRELQPHQHAHWDYYTIGGSWSAQPVIPLADLTQAHLDNAHSIVYEGHWFDCWAYRPWLPPGHGEDKMFTRKAQIELPTVEWLQTQPHRSACAVIVDCHN